MRNDELSRLVSEEEELKRKIELLREKQANMPPQPEKSLLLQMNKAIAKCDSDTVHHCLRVGVGAKKVMKEYVERYHPEVDYTPDILQWAATLHDIGKSKVPMRVLMKPTSLTPEERAVVIKHPTYGVPIMAQFIDPRYERVRSVAYDVILYHHERYDGRGYPQNLAGEEIPLSAQLVGLADCYDALISARPYKPAFLPEKAYRMIRNGECGAFSERVLSCLPVLLDGEVPD